ncbi:restriction endonuclease [Roseomonas sp. KE2513]|uniref:restriction endonuclease n=1 Tax=Roseomonas sp. KE2513 TaxID=2479202 RepID=UPI0018DFCE29|nr:restriction endonuclease [Roseomonas sp. KE2513]MBI0537839.1 restriction endonuclease [Roseomonas sp. KE2513]
MVLLLAAIALLGLAALLVLVHAVPVEPAAPEPLPTLTPRQFEQHCGDVLAARGWSVAVGRGSGDQGVDVLARKDGRALVIQCKLHARPVGNKAVQEALAGRGYAGADAAAVVSNAPYTAAAHALAARVGVLLLNVADLPRIERLIEWPETPATPLPEAAPTRPRRRRTRRPAARPARRIPARPLAAAILAGIILFMPRMAPEPPAPPRAIARPAPPRPPAVVEQPEIAPSRARRAA